MIYSKVENPKCCICANADDDCTQGNVICHFKGTVPEDFCCRKFKYDIFKKTVRPHKNIIKNKFTEKDFVV